MVDQVWTTQLEIFQVGKIILLWLDDGVLKLRLIIKVGECYVRDAFQFAWCLVISEVNYIGFSPGNGGYTFKTARSSFRPLPGLGSSTFALRPVRWQNALGFRPSLLVHFRFARLLWQHWSCDVVNQQWFGIWWGWLVNTRGSQPTIDHQECGRSAKIKPNQSYCECPTQEGSQGRITIYVYSINGGKPNPINRLMEQAMGGDLGFLTA